MLIVKCDEQYLADVRAFADKVGAREQFEAQLAWLANYQQQDGVIRAKCLLFKDFSPFSFEFVLVRIARTFVEYEHTCEKCGYTIWSESDTPWPQCYVYECQHNAPLTTTGRTRERTVEEQRDFNGGLLYYGPGDVGVSVPQFSVRSDGPAKKHEWSIHT